MCCSPPNERYPNTPCFAICGEKFKSDPLKWGNISKFVSDIRFMRTVRRAHTDSRVYAKSGESRSTENDQNDAWHTGEKN